MGSNHRLHGYNFNFRPSSAAAEPVSYRISPGYFESAGTALLAGRAFSWSDDKNSTRVAVINAELARKLFGSPATAVDRFFKLRDGTRVQVVGVAEDGKYTANIAEGPQSALFQPLRRLPPLTSGS